MTQEKRYLTLGLMILAVWASEPLKVFGATPTEQIKETVEQVLGILQNPGVGGESERKETLREVLAPRFNFKEMARMSLGSHWNRQAERQQEFVSVFTDFIEGTYVGRIESLKDTKIVYVREQVDGGFAQVDTRLIPSKGDDIPIRYKLHLVGEEWKIYDVVIDKISLVENYRSQFNRILTVATFDDLLKKLQQKISARGG